MQYRYGYCLVISHPSSDSCSGSRLTNTNSAHSRIKSSQQANLTNYTIWSLFSLHYRPRTRSSSVVTLARPSVSSSLQITNCSFRYASPFLWNQLPSSLRQPHSVHPPPGSPHPAHITHFSRYLCSLYLSLPQPFTPDLRLISFTNPLPP